MVSQDRYEREKRFLILYLATVLVPLIPVALLYLMFSQQNFSEVKLVNMGIQLGGPIAAYYVLYRTSRSWADRAIGPVREHMDTLSDPELANVLLEFDSAAFRTPFRLEESYTAFQRRLEEVRSHVTSQMRYVDPRIKRPVRDLLDLLNSLINLARSQHYYLPYRPEALLIDAVRFRIVNSVNQVLRMIGYPNAIDTELLTRGSAPHWHDLPDTLISEYRSLTTNFGIEPAVVDEYIAEVRKASV